MVLEERLSLSPDTEVGSIPLSTDENDGSVHIRLSLAELIEMQVDRSMGSPMRKSSSRNVEAMSNSSTESDDESTGALTSDVRTVNVCAKMYSSGDTLLIQPSPSAQIVNQLENVNDSAVPHKVLGSDRKKNAALGNEREWLPMKKRVHSKFRSEAKIDDTHSHPFVGTSKCLKRKSITKDITVECKEVVSAMSDKSELAVCEDGTPTNNKSPRLSASFDQSASGPSYLIDKEGHAVAKPLAHDVDNVLGTFKQPSRNQSHVSRNLSADNTSEKIYSGTGSGAQWKKSRWVEQWHNEVPMTEGSHKTIENTTEPETGASLTGGEMEEDPDHNTRPDIELASPDQQKQFQDSQLSVLDYHMLKSLQNIESHKYLARNDNVCKSLSTSKKNFFKYSDLVELIIEKRFDVAEGRKVEPLLQARIKAIRDNQSEPSSDEDTVTTGGGLDLSASATSNIVRKQSVIQSVASVRHAENLRAGKFYWSKKVTNPPPVPQLNDSQWNSLCSYIPGRLLQSGASASE